MPFAWSETYGARLGVMRRDDARAPVRWFDIPPCYVFHVMNAFDDGEAIVLDAVRYDELWRKDARSFERATLHRWTIDLAAQAVRQTALDDAHIEFPRIDERRLGSAYEAGYAVRAYDDRRTIVRYDLGRSNSPERDFGDGLFAGEPVFVPAAGGAERGRGMAARVRLRCRSRRERLRDPRCGRHHGCAGRVGRAAAPRPVRFPRQLDRRRGARVMRSAPLLWSLLFSVVLPLVAVQFLTHRGWTAVGALAVAAIFPLAARCRRVHSHAQHRRDLRRRPSCR